MSSSLLAHSHTIVWDPAGHCGTRRKLDDKDDPGVQPTVGRETSGELEFTGLEGLSSHLAGTLTTWSHFLAAYRRTFGHQEATMWSTREG
jgi:hypothetical protein